MKYTIEASCDGLELGTRCVQCGERDAVATVVTESQNAAMLGTMMLENLSLRVPVCVQCHRNDRTLTRAAIGLLLGPWIVIAALSLRPALIGAQLVPALVAAGVFGFCGIGLYWYRRYRAGGVRVLLARGNRVTLGIRDERLAHRLAELNGVVVHRNSFWDHVRTLV